MKRLQHLLILISLLPLTLIAKPVKIDDLLTRQSEWQVDTSLGYTTATSASVAGNRCLTIPGSQGDNTVCFTGGVVDGQIETNNDVLSLNANLRYGMSADIELFTYASASANYIRNTTIRGSGTEFTSTHDSQLDNFGAGISWQLKPETTSPALLFSVATDIISYTSSPTDDHFSDNFTSLNTSLTTYYTVDPLVFLLRGGLQVNFAQHNDDGYTVKPGNIFTLEPALYFAINPYTTINWGYKFRIKSSDYLGYQGTYTDDRAALPYAQASQRQTSSALRMGLAYELGSGNTMTIDFENENTAIYSGTTIFIGFTCGL